MGMLAAKPHVDDEKQRECPLCQAASGRKALPQYSRDEWRLRQCLCCGFVYMENPPEYERLVEEFAWERTWSAERDRRRRRMPFLTWLDETTRWRLTMFCEDEDSKFRRLFAPGRLLDVGCGEGTRVPSPFIPFGVEISRQLHAQADALMRSRGGCAIHAEAVKGVAAFPEGHFSGAILNSFLEHEKAPAELLAAVVRVLAPGGRMFVKVPNYGSINRLLMGAEWCGFRYPDHVNYFTLSSLKAMASKSGLGFRLLNALTLPLDDNIHAMLSKPD